MHQRNIPIFKPFLFFVLGVMFSYYSGIPVLYTGGLFFLSLIFGYFLMYSNWSHMRWISISGMNFLLSSFFVGAFIYSVKNDYKPFEDDTYSYCAIVHSIKSIKNNRTRCFIDLVAVKDVKLERPYRIIANVENTNILPGDTLIAHSYIRTLQPNSNRGQFNIQKYYGYKYVYQTTTLHSDRMILSPFKGLFHFTRWCQISSVWCQNVLDKYIPERSSNTMKALILGVKDDISAEMMQVYQYSGVMHVLAVSGMHVGILYLGLLVLLRPIRKRWKYISLLPIVFIWIFAFITGAGPAILRAVLMITFVDFGKKMNENTDSMNLLFVSGWCMLIFQPYLLWDIGFQLSFAAILGILVFMKPLQNLIYIKNKWVKEYIWSPTALSVSAQLATTPISFFYFGNFPLLFAVTNLIILLPITIALYGGVLLLTLVSFLPTTLNYTIGSLLDFIIYYGFNLPLQWIVQLPGTYMSNIYISPFQLAILLSAVCFLGYWMYHVKKAKWLMVSVSLLFLSSSISLLHLINNRSKVLVGILQIPGQHAIAVNNFLWCGDQNSNSVINDNPYQLGGYLKTTGWDKWRYSTPSFVDADSNLLTVGGKRFYILQEPLYKFSGGKPIEVDYLLLDENLYLQVDLLREKFDYKYLVLDGSLPYSKYRLFKNLLDNAGYTYIDTRVEGATEFTL